MCVVKPNWRNPQVFGGGKSLVKPPFVLFGACTYLRCYLNVCWNSPRGLSSKRLRAEWLGAGPGPGRNPPGGEGSQWKLWGSPATQLLAFLFPRDVKNAVWRCIEHGFFLLQFPHGFDEYAIHLLNAMSCLNILVENSWWLRTGCLVLFSGKGGSVLRC